MYSFAFVKEGKEYAASFHLDRNADRARIVIDSQSMPLGTIFTPMESHEDEPIIYITTVNGAFIAVLQLMPATSQFQLVYDYAGLTQCVQMNLSALLAEHQWRHVA